MPLNKAKGNMYEWVTHTWNPLAGECSHGCSYCSTNNLQAMEKTIEKLCKEYLPNGRDLKTFKEAEILHLEMAFIQGANVMMNHIKDGGLANGSTSESGWDLHFVIGSACKSHKIKKRSYLEWSEYAERQTKRGVTQYKCSKCGKWLFPSEI